MTEQHLPRDDLDSSGGGDLCATRLGEADAVRAREPLSISSSELLRGQLSVAIDHEGMRYVLRATRAGKLILTK